MRPSHVVQGFKSLASKLHPQLPLTPRESNSLLKTLTSSFRKHLDEAHPVVSESDSRPTIEARKDLSKQSASTIHSSAVLTDQFIASVLTNPILLGKAGGRGVLDFRSAVAELEKNSGKDPIELLERYQEQGVASVQIAEVCLEAAWSHYRKLTVEDRDDYIKTIQPGRRALRWLLTSRAFEFKAFWCPDSYKFVFAKLATRFLLLEGREENVWHWVSSDLPSPRIESSKLRADVAHDTAPQTRYTWRGHVVQSMAAHFVAVADTQKSHPPSTEGINRALDVYIQAAEMMMSVDPSHHLHWIDLRPCFRTILPSFTMTSHVRQDIDPARFDRFHDLLGSVSIADSDPRILFTKATVQLWHPNGRRALPIYEFFRSMFYGRLTWKNERFMQSMNAKGYRYLSRTLTCAVVVLRHSGHAAEATWLYETASMEIPGFEKSYHEHEALYAREFEVKSPKSTNTIEDKHRDQYVGDYSLSLT